MKSYFLLAFVLYLSSVFAAFDNETSDFIIETKQIIIPEHPHAFNPSVIRWQGRLLLCFREITSLTTRSSSCPFGCASRLGLVWLDEELNPISQPTMLEFPYQQVHRTEDARLVIVGDDLYIVYSDHIDYDLPGKGCRVFIATILQEAQSFSLNNIECLSQFEGENCFRHEKNWVPFDYFGNILLSYTISPHQVLFPLLGTGYCETFSTSERRIDWQWGELRGGTPAVLVDGQYLGFFHSSQEMCTTYSEGENSLHYFMGAYTFTSHYPFYITQISPRPIFNEDLYRSPPYVPYWKPIRAVFPCGMIVEGDEIWVSFGKQDHEMWIMKIDKARLMNSLISVPYQ